MELGYKSALPAGEGLVWGKKKNANGLPFYYQK